MKRNGSRTKQSLGRNPALVCLLVCMGGGAFGVCTETLDYAWFLRKPGALDEYIIALDENGHLIVEGEVHENKTVATHLSTYAVSGSVVWQVKNSSGTQVAAVYQNNQTEKYDLVLAGPLDEDDPDFSYYSEAPNHIRVTKSAVPLMELKQEYHDQDTDVSDGTLVIECTKQDNRPVGFIEERWDDPEQGAASLADPNHFTFVPGTDRTILVTEQETFKIRIIEDDGTLRAGDLEDLSALLTRPPDEEGQHGLMGIACHPDFAAPQSPKRFIYVYGTDVNSVTFSGDPYRPDIEAWVNKVYRFEVNSQMTPIATPAPVPGSPLVYAGNRPASSIERLDHTGGCLRAYSDGAHDYLLLSTGCVDHENDSGEMSCRPQDVRVYPGKLLRYEIESDGDLSIPENNPFTGWLTATPTEEPTPVPTPGERLPRAEIIASGLRNPYTFGLRPGEDPDVPSEIWVADVGGVSTRGFEEINRMSLSFSATPNPSDHKNFGFPRVEGNSSGSVVWPSSGYEMYTGCDAGCSNGNGDLSDCASFPNTSFAGLSPPAVFYLRPYGTNPKYGTVTSPVFITSGFLPSGYERDLLFMDFVTGIISRVDESILDDPEPINTLTDNFDWFNTGRNFSNREMIEGPDGSLYILLNNSMHRIRFRTGL
ncbi:MAG: hypothetical protein GHCLOJNM_03422 [bacterium]|nr:hypothetical protein [bacterium]